MKSLEQLVNAIYELGFTEETIRFFAKNREFVLESWTVSEATRDICQQIGFDNDDFRHYIAEPVYTYFSSILKKEGYGASCPAMRSLVERFYQIGLKVEQIFINCTTFKNTILRVYDDQHAVDLCDDKHKLLMILDYNLYGILSLYSDIIHSLKSDLNDRNKIIEENVLLSRTDSYGTIVEVTEAFSHLCGYEKYELVGQSHALLRHPEVDSSLYHSMWKTISSGETWYGEIPNLRKDGSTFITSIKIVPILEDGNPAEYLAIRNDITSEHLALHDSLTGLYNRRAFDTKVLMLFNEPAFHDETFSVIMCDIDYFKHINDHYGHLHGDEILQQVGEILIEHTRANDICARWGGEEFIIVLPFTSLPHAMETAEQIRTAIESASFVDAIKVTCSFGVTEKTKGESIKSLLQRTDKKLFKAKEYGRNRVVSE